MTYKEILEDVLKKHGLKQCKSCDSYSSHKRGFVRNDDKLTIHLDSEIATRSTLHKALHEVGHCVNNESGQRRYEQEAGAEKFASDTMREYGISIPRIVVQRGASYVARKKRHGDRIREALTK